MFEAARIADPLSGIVSAYLQMTYFFAGREEDSRAEYERTIDLPGSREIQEHTAFFRAWNLGDKARTRAQFRRYLDSQGVPTPVLAQLLDVLERPEAARALLHEALDDPANHDPIRTLFIGWHGALYGDDELAIAASRRSLIDEFWLSGKFVLWWPFMRSARRKQAFRQLARDLGLYDYWRASGNWGDFAQPVGDDDFEFIR